MFILPSCKAICLLRPTFVQSFSGRPKQFLLHLLSGFELVSLTADTAEYKEVKQHFFKTIPSSYRIIEIQRVQNPILYKEYTK